MALVDNKNNVKYEVRATGKLIAFVSSYILARLVAGIYMIFNNVDSVRIEQVFPWDDDFDQDTHISPFHPKFSGK